MQTIVIPAVELFDASEIFAVSAEVVEPQEKNRSDTSAASNSGFKELLGLHFEEILPEKNNGADFVLNEEIKFNTPLASSSQCRKQELIDLARENSRLRNG